MTCSPTLENCFINYELHLNSFNFLSPAHLFELHLYLRHQMYNFTFSHMSVQIHSFSSHFVYFAAGRKQKHLQGIKKQLSYHDLNVTKMLRGLEL